jgi:hypothetical protein
MLVICLKPVTRAGIAVDAVATDTDTSFVTGRDRA